MAIVNDCSEAFRAKLLWLVVLLLSFYPQSLSRLQEVVVSWYYKFLRNVYSHTVVSIILVSNVGKVSAMDSGPWPELLSLSDPRGCQSLFWLSCTQWQYEHTCVRLSREMQDCHAQCMWAPCACLWFVCEHCVMSVFASFERYVCKMWASDPLVFCKITNITVYHVNKGNVNGQSSPWKSLLRAVGDCVPCQEWYGTRHCQARLCVSWLATMMETHSHSGIMRCNIEKIFLECVIMWQTFWCSTQCGSIYP